MKALPCLAKGTQFEMFFFVCCYTHKNCVTTTVGTLEHVGYHKSIMYIYWERTKLILSSHAVNKAGVFWLVYGLEGDKTWNQKGPFKASKIQFDT